MTSPRRTLSARKQRSRDDRGSRSRASLNYEPAANAEPETRVDMDMKNSWTGSEAHALAAPEESLALSVHRCQSGAFERLIDRFETSLYNYAHGILQNAFDAQEVVQDAIMRAHKALTRQYDEARCAALALRPWLFRTVRNLSLNKARSKRSSLEQPLESFDDGRLGPFGHLEGSEPE